MMGKKRGKYDCFCAKYTYGKWLRSHCIAIAEIFRVYCA